MSAPFTPGPWGAFAGHHRTRIEGKASEVICEIWELNECKNGNINLIAAAPELYEALQECLAIVRVQNGNLHADTNAIQERALAALAKAEGKV